MNVEYNTANCLTKILYSTAKKIQEMDTEEIDNIVNQRYRYCLWILKFFEI